MASIFSSASRIFDFQFLQLRCGEAFGIDQCLLAFVIGGARCMFAFEISM